MVRNKILIILISINTLISIPVHSEEIGYYSISKNGYTGLMSVRDISSSEKRKNWGVRRWFAL